MFFLIKDNHIDTNIDLLNDDSEEGSTNIQNNQTISSESLKMF
jgi:hypothetical protein